MIGCPPPASIFVGWCVFMLGVSSGRHGRSIETGGFCSVCPVSY